MTTRNGKFCKSRQPKLNLKTTYGACCSEAKDGAGESFAASDPSTELSSGGWVGVGGCGVGAACGVEEAAA